jgi:hypothetical protein
MSSPASALVAIVAVIAACALIWNLWKRQREEIIERLGGDQILADRFLDSGRLSWAEDRIALSAT